MHQNLNLDNAIFVGENHWEKVTDFGTIDRADLEREKTIKKRAGLSI